VPIVLMLFALIFRGIAFEFRFRAGRYRHLWDWAFARRFGLGWVLPGHHRRRLRQRHSGSRRRLCRRPFDFLRALSVMCGLGLVAGYALLGATWLIFKTAGTTQAGGRRDRHCSPVLVSLWTPLANARVALRWFGWPNIIFRWPVPIVTALIAYRIWREIDGDHDARRFLLSIALVLLAFLGLGISSWPYAVPYQLTLRQAASSPPTQAFVGAGLVVTLPLILAYLGYAHWIFRGKTRAGVGYGG
jgi:cytochrome d ubiquinol oxidase subunit II